MADVTNTMPSVSEEIREAIPSSSKEATVEKREAVEKIKRPTTAEVRKPRPSPSKGEKVKKKVPFVTNEVDHLTKQIKKLHASKVKLQTNLKQAFKLSKNKTFLNAMKNFTSVAMIFTTVLLQFREVKKKKMGKRFTKKEKVMSLTLFKQSPKAYRWLRKVFVLPAPSTLSRMISRAGLQPGINENIFNSWGRVKKMKNDDKLCIPLFDEISILERF